MSRRGNPYDNAQCESFIKTVKCEEVYLNEYETFQDIVNRLLRFLDRSTMRNGSIRRWVTSARWILRNDMLGERPKSEPVSVQLQGVTPTTGEIYFGIDKSYRTATIRHLNPRFP